MLTLIKITELISVSIVRYFWFFIIARKKIDDWDVHPEKTAYLIAANHTAAFDPFIITSNLPWKHIIRLTPYFFMTHNRFFSPILRPWLFLHGCFPAFRHKTMGYGLTEAGKLLKRGHTVLMFPEGGVSKLNRERRVKRGIEQLVALENVMVLPTRVRWNRKRLLFRSYSLSIGRPFNGKNMTAEQIMDVVYSLKFR